MTTEFETLAVRMRQSSQQANKAALAGANAIPASTMRPHSPSKPRSDAELGAAMGYKPMHTVSVVQVLIPGSDAERASRMSYGQAQARGLQR